MSSRFFRRRSTERCQACRSRQTRPVRQGVAAVEMALVLPLLLLIAFGTISVGKLIYFRKCMVTATAEGVRLASQRATTSEEVTQRITAVLDSRRIGGAAIEINDGSEILNLSPGALVEINVQADFPSLGVAAFGLNIPVPVTVEAAILRE